ncbi:MAG: hypothetical protein EXQ60_04190 [Candidatus Nanopelagicales bacterium]|nr:hypothetical protein [Candidatus Nanopelagicales bacterium]
MAKTDKNSGVRGPSGPPPRGSQPAPKAKSPKGAGSGRRVMERKSYPILVMLHRVPRWLLVILTALALFLGLIQTGDLAWLGGILLLLVAAFLGWLLVLSWPVLGFVARLLRLVVVIAVVGIAIYKFMGRI